MKGEFILKFNADTVERFYQDLKSLLPDARITWRRNSNPTTKLEDSSQADAATIQLESGVFLEYFRNRGEVDLSVIPNNQQQSVIQLLRRHRLYSEPSTGWLTTATCIIITLTAAALDHLHTNSRYYHTDTVEILFFMGVLVSLGLIWGGWSIMKKSAYLNKTPSSRFKFGKLLASLGLILTIPSSLILASIFRHPGQFALFRAIKNPEQAVQH